MTEINKSRLTAICAKKMGNDNAPDFIDWVYSYSLPEAFTLDQVLTEFKPEYTKDDDKSFSDQFAACLKAFFEIEGYEHSKRRERVNGKLQMMWRAVK
jgi:hypothetical protein